MGASTLAFFPTRNAAVSEGPTELVMLGTLVREAIEREELGFQIVPGSASARPAHIAGLDLQAPRMAWLVDGDGGGRSLTEKFTGQGIPLDRIICIGGDPNSGLVVEDLVDPTVYVEAVNEEIGRRGGEMTMSTGDLSATNRPASVATWCEANGVDEPDKIAVAHHVVERRTTSDLVDPDRVQLVRQIHADLAAAIDRTD